LCTPGLFGWCSTRLSGRCLPGINSGPWRPKQAHGDDDNIIIYSNGAVEPHESLLALPTLFNQLWCLHNELAFEPSLRNNIHAFFPHTLRHESYIFIFSALRNEILFSDLKGRHYWLFGSLDEPVLDGIVLDKFILCSGGDSTIYVYTKTICRIRSEAAMNKNVTNEISMDQIVHRTNTS